SLGVRSMARTEFISISKQELRSGLRRVREIISRTATYLRPAVQLVGALLVGRAPLVCKLAARNLFHDRLRFAATLTGVLFSMVLVTVQGSEGEDPLGDPGHSLVHDHPVCLHAA